MNSLRGFFLTFVIALVIFGTCAFFVTGFITDSINDMISGKDKPDETADPASSSTEATLSTIDPSDGIKGESFTALLIGTDYRPSILNDYHPDIASEYPYFSNPANLIGYEGSLPVFPYRPVHADAVVLVSVNKEKRAVTYMQIPTEMQLSVGGIQTTVRDLYYDKGLDYFVNKMSGITGMSIDYYALTSIEQLADVVNAMGSINFTVPCDMDYTDDISGLTISLESGMQELTGNDICGLLAFTSYTNPALSREKTTISFLRTLMQKMTNVTYLTKAPEIFASASKAICTNFTASDLADNIDLIFSYNSFSVTSVEYPGSYYYRDDARYFTPNISAAISQMTKYK